MIFLNKAPIECCILKKEKHSFEFLNYMLDKNNNISKFYKKAEIFDIFFS